MANTPLASLKFPGLPDTYTIPKNDELVNEGVKTALLQLAQKVAYIDGHGQDYYDDLYNALYPAVGVNNIIAVFNSGGVTIYDTNTLDDLRQYLTVTAIMTDSSTEVVTTYTLSGSMDAGTQTITVSYGGKTTTFSVTIAEWLVSISAAFTQGANTIWSDDSLDTLTQYLVVTATYADTTTATVASTDYTLSGTLDSATSTITVSYAGKTVTFSVSVTLIGSTEYASTSMSNLNLVSTTTIRGITDGVLWQKCSSASQASSWLNWAADTNTTLLSALLNKKVRVRVSCRSTNWSGDLGSSNQYCVRFLAFANANISSLGTANRVYTWALSPNQDFQPESSFTTHEWVLTLDPSSATAGGAAQSASNTAGIVLWCITQNKVEVESISVREVLN